MFPFLVCFKCQRSCLLKFPCHSILTPWPSRLPFCLIESKLADPLFGTKNFDQILVGQNDHSIFDDWRMYSLSRISEVRGKTYV